MYSLYSSIFLLVRCSDSTPVIRITEFVRRNGLVSIEVELKYLGMEGAVFVFD